MAGMRMALVGACAALALAACDNGPSAVAPQAAGTQMAIPQDEAPARSASADRARVDHRNDPVPVVDGKPMWSASRRYSAEQNAERAFTRNGEAFGAETLDEFVKTAHAFVDNPPRGTLTYMRPNGDKLFYDPKGNVFAVANRAGAPRTMFKPDEGRAYWDEQMRREQRRQTAAANRRTRDDDA